MKVILLKDVAKIGKKFEVKEVSDGHAVNFLIPRGLAQIATGSSVKSVETMLAQKGTEKKIKEDLLMKNIADLKGAHVEVSEKANDKGHLFAGLHAQEIATLIQAQTRLQVSAEHIKLDKPIKEVGEHTIKVSVEGKEAEFTLKIVPKE